MAIYLNPFSRVVGFSFEGVPAYLSYSFASFGVKWTSHVEDAACFDPVALPDPPYPDPGYLITNTWIDGIQWGYYSGVGDTIFTTSPPFTEKLAPVSTYDIKGRVLGNPQVKIKDFPQGGPGENVAPYSLGFDVVGSRVQPGISETPHLRAKWAPNPLLSKRSWQGLTSVPLEFGGAPLGGLMCVLTGAGTGLQKVSVSPFVPARATQWRWGAKFMANFGNMIAEHTILGKTYTYKCTGSLWRDWPPPVGLFPNASVLLLFERQDLIGG